MAYKYLIWAVLLGFGGAGGWLGWWYASQSLYMRSVGSDILGDADIKPKVLLWRQLRRLVWAGAGVGWDLALGEVAGGAWAAWAEGWAAWGWAV